MDLLDTPIYYVVMAGAFLAVLFAIRPALDPSFPMSRVSRAVRLIAGPIWTVVIVFAMISRIVEQACQR